MSRIGAAIRKRALSYPDTREDHPWGLALALPGSEPTHYGLGSKGWVTVRPTSKISMAVLGLLIDESYRGVAPKRIVATLGAPPRLP